MKKPRKQFYSLKREKILTPNYTIDATPNYKQSADGIAPTVSFPNFFKKA